jgi:hypothetical protein
LLLAFRALRLLKRFDAEMEMPVPVQREVEAVLRPHEQVLVDLMFAGWKGWWNNSDRPILDFKRARACIIHNHIIREAKKRFGEGSGVHVIEGQETAYFLFDRRLVVRLKKGDAHGLSSNYPTQTALALVDPTAFPSELPYGLPDVQRVDVVYVLNELETRITDVLVVARNGSKVLWQYGIYPRAVEAATDLPVRPSVPASPEDVLSIPSTDEKRKRTHH